VISIRTARRAAFAVLLAASLALAGATPGSAAPTVPLQPGTLAVDDVPPRVPWMDLETNRIHQPDRARISTGRYPSTSLLHADGGYVMQTRKGGVIFMSTNGRTIRLLSTTKGWTPVMVSEAGSWVVLAAATGRGLKVVRVSDGRVVGTRGLKADLEVLGAGDGKVLVRATKPGPESGTTISSTAWWDPTTPDFDVWDRQVLDYSPRSAVVPAASIATHRVAVRAGKRDLVLDLRTKRRLWHTDEGEFVLSFSPDDNRVVTASRLQGFNQEAPWELARTLRVRSAATGAVLRTFTGNFGVYAKASAPVWEDGTTLLLHATDDWLADPEGEGSYPNASVVRCSVRVTSCERVPEIDIRDPLLLRKSN
jgi:hypothetical protein